MQIHVGPWIVVTIQIKQIESVDASPTLSCQPTILLGAHINESGLQTYDPIFRGTIILNKQLRLVLAKHQGSDWYIAKCCWLEKNTSNDSSDCPSVECQ